VTPVVPNPSASAPVAGTGGKGTLDGVVGQIRNLLGGGGQ
jgi:hypothetical protein